MEKNWCWKQEIHGRVLKKESRWHDTNHTDSHYTLHLPVLWGKHQMTSSLFLLCNKILNIFKFSILETLASLLQKGYSKLENHFFFFFAKLKNKYNFSIYVLIFYFDTIQLYLLNPLPHRDVFWGFCKQSRPRSVSSCKSCQIRVYSVCINENMIRYDPTLMDLTSNFFVIHTNVKVYLYNYS